MQFQKNPSQNQLRYLYWQNVYKINYICSLLCVVTDPLPTARKFKPLLWEGAGRSVDIFWTVLHSARNMYRN